MDISREDVLEEYLEERGLVGKGDGHKIRYLSGGVSGTVAFVERSDSFPLIVKEALQKLKTKADWECDPGRMETEAEANEVYHEIDPESAPKVLFYDKENHIYVREALPESWRMWKNDLMSGCLDFNIAAKSVKTLLEVHEKSSSSKEIRAKFASKDVFDNLRIDPYIRYTVKKYPGLANRAESVIALLLGSSIALVHGDYSPKNIMTDGKQIAVLDFEVAHYGHPAFDLAFFFNHFILKAVKFAEYGNAYLAMMMYMKELYFSSMSYMDRDELERNVMDVLPFLMLARVDGKSPVEYLSSDEKKKERVRNMALALLLESRPSFKDIISAYNKEN